MSRLDQALKLATIADLVSRVYDAAVKRKRDREADEKDRRIRDLEDRIAKLEAAKEGAPR